MTLTDHELSELEALTNNRPHMSTTSVMSLEKRGLVSYDEFWKQYVITKAGSIKYLLALIARVSDPALRAVLRAEVGRLAG